MWFGWLRPGIHEVLERLDAERQYAITCLNDHADRHERLAEAHRDAIADLTERARTASEEADMARAHAREV